MTPRLSKRWPGVSDEFQRHPKAEFTDYPLGNSVSINGGEAVARSVILNLTGGEALKKYRADESRG